MKNSRSYFFDSSFKFEGVKQFVKTAFKKFEAKSDSITSNFSKPVFHKFYLAHY